MEDNSPPLTNRPGGSRSDSANTAYEPLDSAQSLDQPVININTAGEAPIAAHPANPIETAEVFQPARSLWKKVFVIVLIILTIASGLYVALGRGTRGSMTVKSSDFAPQSVALPKVETTQIGDGKRIITINGQLQVSSSMVLNPTTPPVGAVAGQMYYDQATNQLAYYNGSEFLNIVGTPSTNATIQNTTVTNNFFSNISNATAGITTPGGTPGALLKFTGAQTAGNSIAIDNTSHLAISGGLNLTSSSAITSLSFWNDTTLPAEPNVVDADGPVELGMKFQTDINGVINGLRFYKGSTSTGPIVGSLWSNTGTLLAQATFNVVGTGWQKLTFPAPVPVSPDTTYVASYHTMGGGFARDPAYFAASGVDNGPIHALASGIDGGNGVFKYNATPIFPNLSINSVNYWIDIDFSGAVTGLESRIRINGAQISSGDLANDSNLAKRTSSQLFSGRNIFRPSNSSDAFAVQKADTTPLLTVDSSGDAIVIGPGVGTANGIILVLGKRASVGDPAGTEGAIYYNNAQQSFRCFRGGTWENCAQLEIDRSFSLYEEFLGGQNTSFSGNTFGTLGWHAQAIGANGSLVFDPATPAPVPDRPGILELQTPAAANQGTTFLLGSGNGSMLMAPGNIVKTAVAVGSTNQVLRVGLHSQTTSTTQPISGVWWEANAAVNPNWRYCHGDGTTATCTASSVAIAANTWVRLELRIVTTGAGVSSYSSGINGAFSPTINVTIDTTNRVSPAFSCHTTVSSVQSCYWDYYQLKGTTGSAR